MAESFTTCPYKEGTERQPLSQSLQSKLAVSPHVPTKRELKEGETFIIDTTQKFHHMSLQRGN